LSQPIVCGVNHNFIISFYLADCNIFNYITSITKNIYLGLKNNNNEDLSYKSVALNNEHP